MKKYLIIIVIISSFIGVIWWQQARLKRVNDERDKYRTNTSVLMNDVDRYRTKDSLNAVTIGVLELKLSEFAKLRASDADFIRKLHVKNRNLEAITSTQLQTIHELNGKIRDSVVYMPGDTVTTVLKCIDVVDEWYELHGCSTPDGKFAGQFINRDSLIVVETARYKRFLCFLWKTKKLKDRQIDVVSKNPNTQIMGIEHIKIYK